MTERGDEQDVSIARVLTNAELAAAWKSSFDFENAYGSLFRLLLLTGQRRGESGTRDGIVSVYQRYDYEVEKRLALNLWAEHIAR
jgi:hypothetical protein